MFFTRYENLCKSQKKTTTGVAAELGIAKSTVAYWRANNTVIPKQDVLLKIADYFKVSVDYLLGNSVEAHLDKATSNASKPSEHINIIKIAGRDGSYEERALTDEQVELFKKMIAALPEATDL